MSKIFYFGERVAGYDVPVLNEREVRASAGILLLGALIAFMNAWLVGNYDFIKAFVTLFMVEFFIRVLINPKFAPVLTLARLFVSGQSVEYSGAPQKRFAWALGFALSVLMFYLVVIMNVKGMVNLGICMLCLTLIFFEAVFGICIGCKLYNMINKEEAKHCPGGACEIQFKEPIQKTNSTQFAILGVFIFFSVMLFSSQINLSQFGATQGGDCTPPYFAVKMGHEEKWKMHNGCL